MIFNNPESYIKSNSSYSTFTEGALMAVYETECNYNALMKAVGISELRYYEQTGGDLFVNEAGVFSNFINKIKKFFKAIIEKIKTIFRKFVDSYKDKLSDDKFIKKYESKLKNKKFNYEGYKFQELDEYNTYLSTFKVNSLINIDYIVEGDIGETGKALLDDKNISNSIEKNNGVIVYSDKSKLIKEDEICRLVREKCFGDKETFEADINEQIKYLSSVKNTIQAAESSQKAIINNIEEFIKKYDKDINSEELKNSADKIKILNNCIKVAKAASTSLTTVYGIVLDAFKQRSRQAKAICIKTLSTYKESATYINYHNSDDIFSGVIIR